MRGLGFTSPHLYKVESRLLGKPSNDEALWPRVQEVLAYTFRESGKGNMFRKWHLEVVESKHDKDIIERMDMRPTSGTHSRQPVFLTQVPNTKISLAYSVWSPEWVGMTLMPPYTVIAKHRGDLIVKQDTIQFIGQFGPYPCLEGRQ